MRWLYLWMAESGNLVERNDLGRTSVQFDVLLKGVRLCEERYWNVTWKGATATLTCCSGIQ